MHQNGDNSYFAPYLNKKVLENMILDTSVRPDSFKIDFKYRKMIYRFSRYESVIGYKGKDRTECRFLVVVAKCNSWIKTAYPVEDYFY